MLIRPKPFIKDFYNEILLEDDVKALRILNRRLESFFAFYINPLRRYSRKKVCRSNKSWTSLIGTTKLYEYIVPSRQFNWTVPVAGYDSKEYLDNRVIVSYKTKAAKYTETVDSRYYDGEKEVTSCKGNEGLVVYFPDENAIFTPEEKGKFPYAVMGNKCVKIPLRYNSIVTTVGGRYFWDVLNEAKAAWREADKRAKDTYRNREALPLIATELNLFLTKNIPVYAKEADRYTGPNACALRLCLKHLKNEIQTYLDKVKSNDQHECTK